MAAVPIYVWNGTAWQETGPVIPASPIAYQASAPSSPSTGDIWVDSDGDVTTGSQQFQRFRFVASGGETSISGVDANGATLAYTAGTEIVALNGSTLVRGQDYTATNGTSITGLSPALVANDVVEVFSFMAFNVANTYTQSQADGLFQTKADNGLILLNTTTIGSAVSSVVVSNCFSSSYDNYLILLTNPTAFSGSNVTLQLRLRSGSTSSTSDYYFIGYNGTTSALNHDTNAPSYFTIGAVSSGVPTLGGSGQIWLYQPYLAQPTHSYVSFMGVDTSLATRRSFSFPGFHNVATSYDSIEILCSTGTMTGGKIRVYGFKN